MKTFTLGFFCLFMASMLFSNDVSSPLFSASFTKNKPIIDGILDDECWKFTGGTNEFIIYGKGHSSRPELSPDGTVIKAIADENFLYVAAEMEHEFLFTEKNQLFKFKKDITEHDGPVWSDDSLEIFIKSESTQQN